MSLGSRKGQTNGRQTSFAYIHSTLSMSIMEAFFSRLKADKIALCLGMNNAQGRCCSQDCEAHVETTSRQNSAAAAVVKPRTRRPPKRYFLSA